MYRAVLFDLDGTLLNTLEDIAAAMNRALEKNGLPGFETEAYKYLVGNGAAILAQRAVRERADMWPRVLRDYQADYEIHNEVLTRPYPGIPELLSALRERGLRLCVLSNKPDADTRHIISHYFGDELFDLVRGQRAGVPIKPDPTAALEIADLMGLPSSDFLYLGDTAVDMECAARAGMRPVGVTWGFRTEEELTQSGAQLLLSHPMELMEALT